jgi:hypothetical protein
LGSVIEAKPGFDFLDDRRSSVMGSVAGEELLALAPPGLFALCFFCMAFSFLGFAIVVIETKKRSLS